MGSATVDAQELANEANKEIAHEANVYNRENLQMQNQWNIEQWNRENEYNSPAAQMQRYIEAGINPLWAISGSSPGQAAHLESAEAAPAEVAHVVPEYDPNRIGNIIAASRDLTNAALGWRKLDLESMDVDTRRAAQMSSSALDFASAANKRAATTQIETENAWNLETFGVRSAQESQKLRNLQKQLSVMDAQSENYRAAAANYRASEDLTREKINRVAEDYQLRWKQIDSMMMNARANVQSSEASMLSAGAAARNAQTNSDRLSFDKRFARAQVAKWNNDQLLDYLKNFSQNISGEMKAGVQVGDLGLSGKAGVSERGLPTMSTFEQAGLRAIEWYADEPSNPNAAEAARIAVDITNQIDNDIHVPYAPSETTSSASILNQTWDSWQ